jgi:hypothetical protein
VSRLVTIRTDKCGFQIGHKAFIDGEVVAIVDDPTEKQKMLGRLNEIECMYEHIDSPRYKAILALMSKLIEKVYGDK